MVETIRQLISGKKIVILGFGREGKSTYRLLERAGGYKELAIADLNPVEAALREKVRCISGEEYQDCLNEYDIVWKSPGVVLQKALEEYSCRILSQTEIFFSHYRKQIIGITGTKGKSTTTTLLYQILKAAGRDTVLAGNIGIPAFDMIDSINENTIIVFEMSSHQLEYMTAAPHIGALLNIYEEHLDHYGTMEKYVAAKERIYRNMMEGDILFCNKENLPLSGTCKAQVIPFPVEDGLNLIMKEEGKPYISYEENLFPIPTEEIHLVGTHNYLDILVAYGIAGLLGIKPEQFKQGLIAYQPLPHRLQRVGTYGGITFYDDSISTICDTTMEALKSIKDANTVLIGGMDRGIHYGELIEFLSKDPVAHIILMEATGKRIYEEIHKEYKNFHAPERLYLVKNLQEAVELSKKITKKGTSCILSPAAASYGIFKNFEERGDIFQKYVKNP
ncbi:MAG: UDP-N-acetylmuramoyl-L-alanine--D-glutamate ligase [Roseburia sp.]|nr:UDP-N-acetylmuramoyl-L-alanine--D-glutamate ligase [Roseburia sp.]MCM1277540.1 UDP-N-acetylmuramoyl-L-alanine--D-glutamate ligase [Robinsoniella sp.]